jgi:hypothetical protein
MLGAEEEKYRVGPLPPIGNSLNAPLQIDEPNTDVQERIIADSSTRLNTLLNQKEFPIEIILLALTCGAIYFAVTRYLPEKKEEPPPPLTTDERLIMAQKIVDDSVDELSDTAAMSLFQLLDPIVEQLPNPHYYLQLSEQAKFARGSLNKNLFSQLFQ